jgi:HK97 family phage major capsid protein
VQRYEALEAKMQRMQRTDEIRKRNAAYNTVPAGQFVHVGTPKKDDTLERAFVSYLRTGKENADLVQLRAQSEGTGSEGGYTVPEGFLNKVIDRMKAFGGLSNVVQNITTDSGNELPWMTLDDTGNTGEIVNENGAWTSGADLVFGTAALNAYSYAAGGAGGTGVLIPKELAQDSAVDLQGILSGKLGMRLARTLAPHLVTGTGVKQPLGITTGLTGVQVNHAGIKYDDLLTVIHSVDPGRGLRPAHRAPGRGARQPVLEHEQASDRVQRVDAGRRHSAEHQRLRRHHRGYELKGPNHHDCS